MVATAALAVAFAYLPLDLALAAAIPAEGVLFLRSLQRRQAANELALSPAIARLIPNPPPSAIGCLSGLLAAIAGAIVGAFFNRGLTAWAAAAAYGVTSGCVATFVVALTAFGVRPRSIRPDPRLERRLRMLDEIKLVDNLIATVKQSEDIDADVLDNLVNYRVRLELDLKGLESEAS
jgi:hypothetical protein